VNGQSQGCPFLSTLSPIRAVCKLRSSCPGARILGEFGFRVGVTVITHLGTSINEINPKQAAHENRIVACLLKRGPLTENAVKLHTGAIQRVGHQIHDAAVNSLLQQGIIRKLTTTTRTNSFILELLKSASTSGPVATAIQSPETTPHTV
jgi:hypothetical protein